MKVIGFEPCQHEDVDSRRCECHRGWCGVCRDCGEAVHAPDSVYRLTGKEVYQIAELHKEQE